MGLAVVQGLRPDLRLSDPEELAGFELDLMSEYALARAAASISDATIRHDLSVISEAREWLGRPLWTMTAQDMDRFLVEGQRGREARTKANKAQSLAIFFEFLELRHAPEIYAATGHVAASPIDEINRPKGSANRRVRVPPTAGELEALFSGWSATWLSPESTGRPRGTTPPCGWRA
jgi:integrase/recombinase XerD